MRIILGNLETDGGTTSVPAGSPEWSDSGKTIVMDVTINDQPVLVAIDRTEILQWAIEAMQSEIDKPALRCVSKTINT